jgi:hypothetical protein
VPELSSRGGRTRCHGTRGSTEAHLGREVRSGAEVRAYETMRDGSVIICNTLGTPGLAVVTLDIFLGSKTSPIDQY